MLGIALPVVAPTSQAWLVLRPLAIFLETDWKNSYYCNSIITLDDTLEEQINLK